MNGPHAVAAILLLCSTGCKSVQAVRSVPDYLATRHPDIVWVTNANNVAMPVMHPLISGDTILGTSLGESVAIPLASAHVVEARQPNYMGTVLLSVGLGGALGAILVLSNAGGSGQGQACRRGDHYETVGAC